MVCRRPSLSVVEVAQHQGAVTVEVNQPVFGHVEAGSLGQCEAGSFDADHVVAVLAGGQFDQPTDAVFVHQYLGACTAGRAGGLEQAHQLVGCLLWRPLLKFARGCH